MENGSQVSTTTQWETLASQANYCPRELARLCHVSLRTLQRRFAENYGITISEWMRKVRLAEAYARVVSGEQIKAVAYDLRFKQLSHFSRVFKEVHGIAPSFISPQARAKTPSAGAAPSGATLVPVLSAPRITMTLPFRPIEKPAAPPVYSTPNEACRAA